MIVLRNTHAPYHTKICRKLGPAEAQLPTQLLPGFKVKADPISVSTERVLLAPALRLPFRSGRLCSQNLPYLLLLTSPGRV